MRRHGTRRSDSSEQLFGFFHLKRQVRHHALEPAVLPLEAGHLVGLLMDFERFRGVGQELVAPLVVLGLADLLFGAERAQRCSFSGKPWFRNALMHCSIVRSSFKNGTMTEIFITQNLGYHPVGAHLYDMTHGFSQQCGANPVCFYRLTGGYGRITHH